MWRRPGDNTDPQCPEPKQLAPHDPHRQPDVDSHDRGADNDHDLRQRDSDATHWDCGPLGQHARGRHHDECNTVADDLYFRDDHSCRDVDHLDAGVVRVDHDRARDLRAGQQ
jgi:hypothetical protein